MDNEQRSQELPTTSSAAGHERPSNTSFNGHDPYGIEEGQQLFPSAQRLGDLGQGEKNQVPVRMAAANPPTNHNFPMGGVSFTPHKHYYTIVLRNYGKVPTNISCLYVEHDNHMHVVFQAKDNVARKVDRLLNDCLLPAENWFDAKSTRQYVRDIYLLLQYFKYRGTVKEVGAEMRDEFEMAHDLQPIEPNHPCHSVLQRQKFRSQAAQRESSRKVKFDSLLSELKSRDVRQFEDIFRLFSVEEITNFNSSIGVQWREIAKQQIQSLNAERLEMEKQCNYLQNLKNLKHECRVANPRDVDIGANWLMMLLNQNGIDIKELLTDIITIMDKKTTKVNTLCFKGQTNTGKTLLTGLITSHLTVRNIDNLISY